MNPLEREKSRLPRTILVAVDARGLSDDAVRAAAGMSKRLGANLAFVHAVGAPGLDWELIQHPRVATSSKGLVRVAEQAILAHLADVLADAGHRGVAVEDLLHVAVGGPAKVILERAREIRADWVVLGALRRRPMFDFGSTARAVLASAPAVWARPHGDQPIQRILVPVDLSPQSIRALEHACALARPLHARLRVVHCFNSVREVIAPIGGYPDFGPGLPVDELRLESEAEFTDAMKAFDWRGVEHDFAFFDAVPVEKILELEKDVDLVVMSTHGRTGLAGAVLGHVAYSVLKHATRSVLAIRDPDAFVREESGAFAAARA